MLCFLLSSKKSKYRLYGNQKTLVEEALSHLPLIVLEYDQSLAKKTTFAQFATQRCILRLIDEYRRMNRHIKLGKTSYNINQSLEYNDKFIFDDPELQTVDWHDLREAILKKVDVFFKELEGSEFAVQNRSSRIHKILIKDYLIPKLNGEKYKTLQEISDQVALRGSRLSQMVRGDRMKNFIRAVYKK